jgi:hypothetical protein
MQDAVGTVDVRAPRAGSRRDTRVGDRDQMLVAGADVDDTARDGRRSQRPRARRAVGTSTIQRMRSASDAQTFKACSRLKPAFRSLETVSPPVEVMNTSPQAAPARR